MAGAVPRGARLVVGGTIRVPLPMRTYNLGTGKLPDGWLLRFNLTGFALFWGEWPKRYTFQLNLFGWKAPSIVYGDCFNRRVLRFRK